MRHFFNFSTVFCLLLLVFSSRCLAQGAIEFDGLPLKSSLKQRVLDGDYIISSEVETNKAGTKQKFDFQTTGLHPKSCRFALRKLKLYENYHQYIEMVQESRYDEKTKDLSILLAPPIISMRLIVNFKLDRIESPGIYHYSFTQGFLNGLKGEIHVSEHKKRCLFYIWAKWEGKKTRFPDQILELFTTAISRLSMSKLFKISSTY